MDVQGRLQHSEATAGVCAVQLTNIVETHEHLVAQVDKLLHWGPLQHLTAGDVQWGKQAAEVIEQLHSSRQQALTQRQAVSKQLHIQCAVGTWQARMQRAKRQNKTEVLERAEVGNATIDMTDKWLSAACLSVVACSSAVFVSATAFVQAELTEVRNCTELLAHEEARGEQMMSAMKNTTELLSSLGGCAATCVVTVQS